MKIEHIKLQMRCYTDFYGGYLLGISEIDKCKTKKQLAKLIEEHRDHLEAMLSDAHSHLDNFKKRLGLRLL